VYFLRDYSAQIQYIENSKGQKCSLKLSQRYKMLHEFRTPDNFSISYDYYGGTGLLKSRLDTSGRSFFYNYDEYGRCTNVITPTGKVISLNFDLNDKGAIIEILENSEKERSLMVQSNQLVEHIGETITRMMIENSGSTTKIAPYGFSVAVETSPHAILSEVDSLVGETYPVPSKQKTELKNELVNRFEWKYSLKRVQNVGQRQKSQPVVKKLRVNGEGILYIEYDKDNQLVTIGTDDKSSTRLLIIQYDKGLRPTAFRSQSGDYSHVELEYDR
jgi:teneurin